MCDCPGWEGAVAHFADTSVWSEVALCGTVGDPPAPWRRATGLPNGQTADYRLTLADGSGLHAHRLPSGDWRIHRDVYDPATSIVGHALADAPALTVGGAAAVGAGIGLLVGGPLGGLLGGLLAGGASALASAGLRR